MPTYHQLFKHRPPPRPNVPRAPARVPHPSEISAGLPTPRQQARLTRTPEHVLVDNEVRYRQRQRVMHAQQLARQGRHQEALALFGRAGAPGTPKPHQGGDLFSRIVSGTVGKHGLLGAGEELAKPVIPAAKAFGTFLAHPERPTRFSDVGKVAQGGISAAVIVPGFGKGTPKPGEIPTPSEQVAGELGAAARGARQQKQVYGQQWAERTARAQQAYEAAGGGVAGQEAFRAELRGKMPRVTFENLRNKNLTPEDLDQLVNQAHAHEDLHPLDRQAVAEAVRNAVEHGKNPTRSEIAKMQQVYGPQETAAIKNYTRNWGETIKGAINIPRTLETIADISALGRQALVSVVSHPLIAGKNIPPMLKAAVSDKFFTAREGQRIADPEYELAKLGKVQFTHTHDFAHLEESFYGAPILEKVPGLRAVVNFSERSFHDYLNQQRLDLFKNRLRIERQKGRAVENLPPAEQVKRLEKIGSVVNAATGRGNFGRFEPARPVANAAFFSPGLIASRLTYLNPVWYARLGPGARAEAVRGLASLAGTTAGALAVAHVLGAHVNLDPRSSDFAKIRLGETRIDLLGGFQQVIRAGAQIGTGQAISTTTGTLRNENRLKTLGRFAWSKLAPIPSEGVTALLGQTFQGTKPNIGSEVYQHSVPLSFQDAVSVYQQRHNLPAALGGYALSGAGLGVQSYKSHSTLSYEAQKHKGDAERQNVHLDNLVRKGILKKEYRPTYRKALDTFNKREINNAAIDLKYRGANKPITAEKEKIVALIDLMRKRGYLDAKTAAEFKHHDLTAKLTAKQLSENRSWLWNKYDATGNGYSLGEIVSWYHDKAGKND